MHHPATEFLLDISEYARAHYGIQFRPSNGSIPSEGNLRPMSPYGNCVTDPKSVRMLRASLRHADYTISWEDIVRTFNPNTVDLDTTRLFWRGLSNHLVDFPPSQFGDPSNVITYDDSKPQRFYKTDLEILHNVSIIKQSLQDYGNDSRTAYIRSLIMQGIALANLSEQTAEVVENEPVSIDSEAASDSSESN